MNELEKQKNEVVTQDSKDDSYKKILTINSSTLDIDYKGAINKIFQYVNIADIINKVEKGVEYIVKIPSEFEGGFKVGDFWIMENQKSGKLWPNLMKLGDDGRQQIVTPLPIKKEEFFKGNPVNDITSNFHNIYMQNKINEISSMLEETIEAVRRIENGQKDDRIGKLEAGKQGILLAMAQKDDESRKHAILLARNEINVAQNQILKTLERKIIDFKPLLRTTFGLFLKQCTSKSDYLGKRDDEYNEILDYYYLYIESTKMLAVSYIIVDDYENAQMVLDIGINKLNKIDYKNLATIEHSHKNAEFEKIYNNPADYLILEKNICMEDAIDYDCLSISINGNELLEVLLNGKEKDKQETE